MNQWQQILKRKFDEQLFVWKWWQNGMHRDTPEMDALQAAPMAM